MHWNLMNDLEFGSLKILKDRRREQIFQLFCRTGFPLIPPPPLLQEIRSSLFNLYKFHKSEKTLPESYRMHWNAVNDEEFRSLKLLESKYRRRVQIVQLFCRIGSSQEIRSPLFKFPKFDDSAKRTPESCKILWNVINDEEFGSLKVLKLKYKKGSK